MKVQTLVANSPLLRSTTFATPLPDSRRDSRPSTLTFSILTPSLNGATYFQQTRDSVMSQAGDFGLQWIVIDGGSHDGTIDHLQSINDPRVQWISEADHGQSAAINKGLVMARGDIVAWLNSDDLYLPGALSAVVDAFTAHPDAQWLIGRCNIIDKDGQVTREVITHYKQRLLHDYTLKGLLRENMICQPAVFWRREFGQSVGLLDESLRYTMDYDLWLRMAKRSTPLIIDRTLASFRVHMASKSRGGHREQFNEGYRVACRYFGNDRLSQVVHRLNVEKIVWGYHTLRLLGR